MHSLEFLILPFLLHQAFRNEKLFNILFFVFIILALIERNIYAMAVSALLYMYVADRRKEIYRAELENDAELKKLINEYEKEAQMEMKIKGDVINLAYSVIELENLYTAVLVSTRNIELTEFLKELSDVIRNIKGVNSFAISIRGGFSFTENLKLDEIDTRKRLLNKGSSTIVVTKTENFFYAVSVSNEFVDRYLKLDDYLKSVIALGVRKCIEYERVKQLSRVCGLTGAFLRRAGIERIEWEIKHTRRYGTNFSVLMLDIDHFKKINDMYGHQAGDFVLKRIVEVIKNLFPQVFISRYGGEEFMIVIGLAPHDEVEGYASKIRQAIENSDFIFDGVKIKVTVSIGIRHYLPVGGSVNEVIADADEALYEAKASGRNCIKVYGKITGG